MNLDLLVTLWPSFPHFQRFVRDPRIAGIRLNSAMMSSPELDKELEIVRQTASTTPLYFDIKGRQPRVEHVIPHDTHLELLLNHPIKVETPCAVLFKAGVDSALLERVEGNRLIFQGGPRYKVYPGESLHIRHPSFEICPVNGSIFTAAELAKVEKVRAAGFTRYFLSYVESQRDVDLFRELVGHDSEVWLKIESEKGLKFVAEEFKPDPHLMLVAARGDLYVEIDKPHNIAAALAQIAFKQPGCCVGSRILLSVLESPVPSCADFLELEWLYERSYRQFMLCDELCLREDLLGAAVNAFDAWRSTIDQTNDPQERDI